MVTIEAVLGLKNVSNHGRLMMVTDNWGHSSAGRALDWQSRGQGFDPPWFHQTHK